MPKNIKRFSVYWVDLGQPEGSEMKKVRPCVVVSFDEMNSFLGTVIIIPLTSTIKKWPCRLTMTFSGQESSVACDQIRVVDKFRIKSYVGKFKPIDKTKVIGILQTIFSE